MLFCTQQNNHFLQNKEIITVDSHYETDIFQDKYLWMKTKYRELINPDYDEHQALIWGWPTREEALYYFEDMPTTSCIIIAEIPDKDVLVTDFYGWHNVLNNYDPKYWDTILNEKDMRQNGLLEENEVFTPQLVTDHLDKSNIIDIIYKQEKD